MRLSADSNHPDFDWIYLYAEVLDVQGSPLNFIVSVDTETEICERYVLDSDGDYVYDRGTGKFITETVLIDGVSVIFRPDTPAAALNKYLEAQK